VVSGIAEYFEPEAIIGKQICLLANLEPREIKCIKSQGMILLAEDATGRLVFMTPEDVVANGAEVK
jgi:methionyl-tRNA synthetase